MKKGMLLLATTFALAACGKAAPDTSAQDQDALKNATGAFFEHHNHGDAAAVANLYAEDAVLQPPNAPAVRGRAAIQAFFATEIQQMKGPGLTINNTGGTGGVSGDMGWNSGTYSVTDASGATVDTGKYLSVSRKVNGNWLYVRDTWNSDNAPPAAPAAAPPTTTK